MKKFTLTRHGRAQRAEEVLINSKDYEGLNTNDLIEIYPSNPGNPCHAQRLILKVTAFADSQTNPIPLKANVISVDDTVAKSFRFPAYCDVMVQVVDKDKVTLDSMEIMFKDQYLSRSMMWRLKSNLVRECVYQDRKIDFCGFRGQVFEMWQQGKRMSSGYIGPDTKVVYRSASSQVFLFLQMSSEMWDYDINGDLYFEKAVNGLLSDLFEKWKIQKCSHDVTIVMFSRTFYDSTDINQFPETMRGCLQKDLYRDRFYEDFYRVVFQNDRQEDWSPTLIELRRLFNQYENEVIRCHETDAPGIPKGYNSTASEGNFLEVLNISLNVFEKHNVDRSFDRTGQLSVVISPGVGVFEVDFHLTNLTKQRIIDNGIGSDLVCLGEQPLHAVPLFKFNRRDTDVYSMNAADVYNMPHWINLSFYSSPSSSTLSSFVPRIKMPTIIDKSTVENNDSFGRKVFARSPTRENGQKNNILSIVDYDEYDEQVFKPSVQPPAPPIIPSPRRKSFINSQHPMAIDKGRHRRASEYWGPNTVETIENTDEDSPNPGGMDIRGRRAPSPIGTPTLSCSAGDQPTGVIKHANTIKSQDDISLLPNLPKQGKSWPHRPKALINPFDPSQVTIKLTSNRRRWTHVFPLGSSGIFMQQHHYQAVPQNTACTMLPSEACLDAEKEEARKVSVSQIKEGSYSFGPKKTSPRPSVNRDDGRGTKRTSVRAQETHSDTMTYAWGATGEQEWTPLITTGVDWKSLVMPACLPITTDFFPDQRSLNNDYHVHVYDLLPEDQAEQMNHVCYRDGEDQRNHIPFSTQQVLEELTSQRLQQGFQLILLPRDINGFGSKSDINLGNKDYTLSIGRIFHNLVMVDNKNIKVRQFKPRHPYACMKIHYCYRFRAPDNNMYGISWVDFTSERLENYKWNYLDNYICTRGEGDYDLEEDKDLKFWRFRLLILPNICQNITQRITELNEAGQRELKCLGAYKENTHADRMQLFNGFLKFIEILSKIKRPPPKKKDPPKRPTPLAVPRSPHSPQMTRNIPGARSPRTKLLPCDEPDGNIPTSPLEPHPFSNKTPPNERNVDEKSSPKLKKIPVPANLQEVADMMKVSPSINCMIEQKGLMPYSFIGAEAIFWSIETFDEVDTEVSALELFRKMHQQGLICHASRDLSFPFVSGLFFYFITDGKPFNVAEVDIDLFARDWLQIEMCLKEVSNTEDIPTTPAKHKWLHHFKFNRATLDLGENITKRVEWIHLRYHSIYDPGQAFEIDMDWLVATGNMIADVIAQWCRKAVAQKLHIVPIPSDPFALPFVGKTDPLRGPIYIQLNLTCLPIVLEGDKLVRFREKILSKWGFLPFYEPGKRQKKYVHVSGSMFVMIPRKSDRKELDTDKGQQEPDPHETYINKHFTGLKHLKDDVKQSEIFKTGFLWSWNYMLTKRWKSQATGDEAFMRRVMDDFKKFCGNDKDRLIEFYNDNQEGYSG